MTPMSILYHRTTTDPATDIKITEDGNGMASMTITTGISQYIVFAPGSPWQKHHMIVDLTGDDPQGDKSPITRTYQLPSFDKEKFAQRLYCCYGIKRQEKAQFIFDMIDPDHTGVKVVNKQGCIIVSSEKNIKICNFNNDTSKYLTATGKIYELPVKVIVVLKEGTYVDLSHPKISDSRGPLAVAYEGLPSGMTEYFVPVGTKNGPVSTRTYEIHDWCPYEETLYRGTLTFVTNRSKQITLMTDTRVYHNYSVDAFKLMVPYLSNGTITGTFRYTPVVASTQLNYVLLPVENDSYGGPFKFCMSDDSDCE